MNINDEQVNVIKNFLINKVEPYVIYLFGSAVNGIFRSDSDIDIAYLSDKDISGYDLFMISQELADLLKRDVDLIDLRKASTVFKAQVVGTKKIIYCNDDLRRMNFEMYALKDYAKLNEERAEIIDKILKRGRIYNE
ncbi:type VII toxin-antitoxin system MntA family adenylyltransferase antitoxin [Thermoanaerobacterium butyriciformans]|uniref:Nucleotidyltransferase n=1 Tax=Thermoanaerobacterium butyriciformans TaxID=1702242 RepID=A0ABS4NBA1_9THEO|nr:nucleotidyltransferase domain-containing protein [Thermoanaerobacterium butyriciformans]MBP2070936.1 putative nucleotidyltransferase [Thermoanaerobacterium butyriciformans]